MDIYDEGFLEFWNLLNKNQVQYIMVGGRSKLTWPYTNDKGCGFVAQRYR